MCVYFPALPSWGLWHGSPKNSLEVASLKSPPISCLSTRTHQIWPRIFLGAMCYEGILNFCGSSSWKTLDLSAHWVIRSQVQARTSVRMHSVWAYVMLPILSPFRTCIVHWTYIYIRGSAMSFETSIYSASASVLKRHKLKALYGAAAFRHWYLG